MIRPYQDEIARFLTAQQAAITQIVEQAQEAAGGHYAAMSPDQRRRQAAIDAQELSASLISGAVDQETIESNIQAIADLSILNDIMRLAAALEQLFTPFVQQRLSGDPKVAQELIIRMSTLSARYRMNLSAAYMARLARRTEGSAPPGAPGR